MGATVGTTDISKDVSWIENSFILAGGQLAANTAITRSRNLSSADFKFTGAGFGQNVVINSIPQMTPLADIRRKGLASLGSSAKSKTGYSSLFQGQGRAYSEMYDDNKQVVHIRFGLSQPKGLVSFFTNFYDAGTATLARQGRASIAYYFGLAAGMLGTLFLQPFILAGKAARYFLGRSSSRYMDLKPTMPLYWERVQVIMNNLGAQMGIIPRLYSTTGKFGENADKVSDLNTEGSTAYKGHLNKLMPKIFSADGQFNVLAAIQQAPKLQALYSERVASMTAGGSGQSAYNNIIGVLSAPLVSSSTVTLENYLKDYHGGVIGSLADKKLDGDTAADILEKAINSGDTATLQSLSGAAATNSDGSTQTNASNATNTSVSNTNELASALKPSTGTSTTDDSKTNTKEMRTTIKARKDSTMTDADKTQLQKDMAEGKDSSLISKAYESVTGWLGDFKEGFVTEFNNGTAFLNVAVEYTGAGTLSLQNATKETTIATTTKGISGAARDSRVAMSDFNTGFGFIDGALGMARNVFSGVLDSVSMSGLMALAGNAFINFPKQWDDSTANVPTANFTLHVRCPYGNDIAQYINVYPIVACLLAGAGALSTGTQSYTSPFLCEAYCRGVCNIRYGMITSLTIRHGTGNLGYNVGSHRPLAFDIDFEIADLSSTFHAPISNGMSPVNVIKNIFDDDNTFNDYLSTITGLGLDDMVNPKRKLAIRWATQISNVKSWWTPEHVASRVAGTAPVQLINKVFGPSYFPGA